MNELVRLEERVELCHSLENLYGSIGGLKQADVSNRRPYSDT